MLQLANRPRHVRAVPAGLVACIDTSLRVENGARRKDEPMLYWAAVFFVIAIVAAIFGFGGIAAQATGIAKILFVVALALAVISLLFGRRRMVV